MRLLPPLRKALGQRAMKTWWQDKLFCLISKTEPQHAKTLVARDSIRISTITISQGLQLYPRRKLVSFNVSSCRWLGHKQPGISNRTALAVNAATGLHHML